MTLRKRDVVVIVIVVNDVIVDNAVNETLRLLADIRNTPTRNTIVWPNTSVILSIGVDVKITHFSTRQSLKHKMDLSI